MRLTFYILWFEDTPRITGPIIEPVKEHLEKKGYYLKIVDILKDSTGLGEIIQKVNEKKLDVDLILMDWNLAGDEKGDTLIDTIRKGELLTDIVFYSEHKGFRDKIGLLDGIYSTDRDYLEEKIIAVTDHILEKALDLSNLRGLVMAETSELESLMDQIILTSLEKGVLMSREMIRRDIKRRLEESLNGRKKKLEQLHVERDEPGKPHDFLDKLDFCGKSRVLKNLLESYSKQEKPADQTGGDRIDLPYESFDHQDFYDQVIEKRNDLAHVKESTDWEGRKILKAKKEGREDFVFDKQIAFDIRNNLKKYYEILTGIYKAVTGKDWN